MKYMKGKIVAPPKAGEKKILQPQKPDVGATEDHLICGKCHTMLVKGCDPAGYQNCAIKCMNCGEFNEV